MATTTYGVNDAETVKLWSNKLFRESLNQTFINRFMGEGTDNIVQVLDDTSKGRGDRITVTLRLQLANNGVTGDGSLEGLEEALVTHTDNLLIEQLRNAVRSGGRMSEQRISFSHRNEARLALQDWWADRIDTWAFNQLGGNTAETNTALTGLNATVSPDTNHILYANNKSSEAVLSASDTMTLDMIDAARERAETLAIPIRPLMIGGEPWYVMFIHPFQYTDLRTNTNTGEWADIQKAAMQGGRISDNPIFTGAAGIYNQTILHVATRVPSVQASTRRAIFCGAQAGVMAFGRDNGPNRMTWVEETFDYGNQLGVAAGMIAGFKKTVFNSADFGTIVVPTWAAQHTA